MSIVIKRILAIGSSTLRPTFSDDTEIHRGRIFTQGIPNHDQVQPRDSKSNLAEISKGEQPQDEQN